MARTAPIPNIPAIPGMCPGIAVLGGGGGAGGKGGKGAGNGNGGNGADGEGGAGAADGDGRGAGSCGTGGPGSCSNCGTNVAAGDPVDVISGKVFTLPKTDLSLPGLFALDIVRNYSSTSRDIDFGLGHGWRHSLAWSMVERRDHLDLRTGDGRHERLPIPASAGEELQYGNWTVIRGEGFFAIVMGNEFVHLFSPMEPGSKQYKLDRVSFRSRGGIELRYDAGLLVEVIDTVGRTVRLARDTSGYITSLAVPSQDGRNLVYARYQYDRAGNLIAVTDADGYVTRYHYDSEHLLTQLDYPNGVSFHFVYDNDKRCVETWGARRDGAEQALAADAPEFLADGQTKAKGIYHCRLTFDDEFSEVVDSIGTRRFEAGPNSQVGKAINARGGVTTRTFNDAGKVASMTNAIGGTWTYEYDSLGHLVRQTDPLGGAVSVSRDWMGRPQEVIDQLGASFHITRDPVGEVAMTRNAKGAIDHFTRDHRGLVTEAQDARGGRHLFEYDSHANCVARTFPSGGRYTFEYDYWGRRIADIDPTGAARRYVYTNRGRVSTIIDRLGRQHELQYGSMGNLHTWSHPDGSTLTWEYSALSWLHRVRQADGSEVRIEYNREGWPVRYLNERGERHEIDYAPDGVVLEERDFHGRVTRFRHDLLGNLTWFDEGKGKHELVVNALGQVVEEIAPDDAVRRFRFDARGELIRAEADDVTLSWSRDIMGNIVSEQLLIEDQPYAVDSQLTIAGDRHSFETTLGHKVTFGRDANGRVEELWVADKRELAIVRDARGLPVRRSFAAGGVVDETFDAETRLVGRKLVEPSAAAPSAGEPQWVGDGGPGHGWWRFDYTAVDELQRVTGADGSVVELEYDLCHHMTRFSRDRNEERFQADAASNYHRVDAPGTERRYGPGGQLLSMGDLNYSYDERGFLIEKNSGSSGETWRYRWNSWGDLEAVELPDTSVVSFKYDAFARRMVKRITAPGGVVSHQHFVWDLLAMVHEVDVLPAAKSEPQTYLFEANDRSTPIGQYDPEGQRWLHYLNTAGGAPEVIVDPAGRVVGNLRHGPFGRTKQSNDGATSPFRLPGQYDDRETGLHYNRYRYYDPDAGGFISPDPIGIQGGLHLYSYGPNPIGWSDPMGWYHTMTLTGHPPNFTPSNAYRYADPSRTGYRSGRTVRTDSNGAPLPNERRRCPAELMENAQCHTEQKFAHDLIAQHRAGENFNRQPFACQGRLPPCPTCHAALMRAASETGADITYTWGQPAGANTVRYNGSSAPTGTGRGADLVDGYTHTSDGTWSDGSTGSPGQIGSTQSWGYTYAGSWTSYYANK